MGVEVSNHHCGGAPGPMYRKPHLEANRRIARARKKCIKRAAPRMATTTKINLSSVTSAILAVSLSATQKLFRSKQNCHRPSRTGLAQSLSTPHAAGISVWTYFGPSILN